MTPKENQIIQKSTIVFLYVISLFKKPGKKERGYDKEIKSEIEE